MRRFLLLTLSLWVMAAAAFAQLRTVSGKVSDASGEPLPGVAVLVKGTTKGTITDMGGNYRLEVAPNAVLLFQFVGYTNQQVTVGNQSTVNMTLTEDSKELSEVVVVGYTKKDEASSVPVIKEVADIITPNVANSLQGKATGVTVNTTTGQPGAKTTIRVRGTGSISAGRDPLYVVDGVIWSGDDLIQGSQQSQRDPISALNQNDIEDIKILKDASATALYGARASNGVVLITTKSGRMGKAKIDLSVQQGASSLYKGNLKLMDAKQYVEWMGYNPDLDEATGEAYVNTSWQDKAFRTGQTANYQLSAQGGNDKTKYYVSGGYYKQEGILVGSDFERYATRLKLDQQLAKKLSLQVGIDLSSINQVDASDGGLFSSPLLASYMQAPIVNPYDEQGNPLANLNDGPTGSNYAPIPANFLFDVGKNYRRTNSLNGGLSGKLIYNVTEWLTASSANTVRFENTRYNNFTDPRTYDGYDGPGLPNGSKYSANAWNSMLTSTNLLNFEKTFADVHNVSAMAGVEYQESNADFSEGYVTGFAVGSDNLGSGSANPSVGGYKDGYKFFSLLSQVAYDYDRRYYVSASLRRDGSSRFSTSNRYGNFWSVGASWNMGNEAFLKDNPWITAAKARASYGTTGNANIGNFASLSLYSFSNAYKTENSAVYTQLPNTNLTWETKKKLNVGVDVSLLKRVHLSVDYYKETSSDLLLAMPLSSTTGFVSVMRNIGDMTNKGVEMQLTTNNLTGAFKWNTTFNMSVNKNVVDKLVDGKDIPNGRQIIREGKSLRTWYLREWAGAAPKNGAASWYVNNPDFQPTEAQLANGSVYERDGRYATTNIALAQRIEAGDAFPRITGGFTNEFSYKGFDLSVFFTFNQGNDIYNATRGYVDGDQRSYYNQYASALDNRWQQEGDIADKPVMGDPNGSSSSTRYLEDGSYISLRNVMLGYTLPKQFTSRIGVASMRVFASAQNLVTFTHYTGYTPVTVSSAGDNFFEYPEGRVFMGGINLSF